MGTFETQVLDPKSASLLVKCSAETCRRHLRNGRVKGEMDVGGRMVVFVARSRLTGLWRLVPRRSRLRP